MAEVTEQPTPEQPTPEEAAKLQGISAAGASAAVEGKDPAQAMKDERDRVKYVKLDDETIDQLAAKLNDLNVADFQRRGAFDPPPEPVRPPEQPVAPPAPGEQPGGAPAQVHEKRTPAHRFFGV